MNELQQQILALLQQVKPDADFSASTHFVEDYLLDSFDVITLCDLIAERFQTEIALDDITADHFASLETIAALVKTS